MKFVFKSVMPYTWFDDEGKDGTVQISSYTRFKKTDWNFIYIMTFAGYILYLATVLFMHKRFSFFLSDLMLLIVVPILVISAFLSLYNYKLTKGIHITHEDVEIDLYDDYMEIKSVLPYHSKYEKDLNVYYLYKIMYKDIRNIGAKFADNEVLGRLCYIEYSNVEIKVFSNNIQTATAKCGEGAFEFSEGIDVNNRFEDFEKMVHYEKVI